VVLHRWIEIRRGRGEWFSAAVAARQLSAWARQTADDEPVSPEGGVPRKASRSLCAASEAGRLAELAIAEARKHKTEFADDLVEFQRRAVENRKRIDARLADAELLLRTQDPNARVCADRTLTERLARAEATRLEALAELAAGKGTARDEAAELLSWVRNRDPSPDVRAKARSLLAGAPTP
jgi:hypothetical protein